jgi:hypothetical protein
MNDTKGYAVLMGGLIWGTGRTQERALHDAYLEGMPEGAGADIYPATARMLAMVALYGGGVSKTLYRGVLCYPDEVPEKTNEEVRT